MTSLLNHYTNRSTGRTTVMSGTTLCGYVEKVADSDRKSGFYYAVLVAKNDDVVGSYCGSDKLSENIQQVYNEWKENR